MAGFLTQFALRAATRRLASLRSDPRAHQEKLACDLAKTFADTKFGRAHDLASVKSATDLSVRVPLRRYQELAPFFERPRYWGITSGSSGEPKAIPVTDELLAASSKGMGLVMSSLFAELGTLAPLFGRILYIGASTPLTLRDDGVLGGPITSIAVHHMSPLARERLVPGQKLDELPDWGAKMDALVDLSRGEDIRVVSGMPPWLLSFAQRVERKLGVRDLRELFPKLAFVVHGGASPEPYREELEARFGPIPFRNVYTATEGFLGFQDSPNPALLPAADSVFFELVPVSEISSPVPQRVLLADAEIDVDYAVVLSSFAGLFGYLLGDTVRFVSRAPLRMVYVGRVEKRLNVAGEKVTAYDLERAMVSAARKLDVELVEASVAPLGPAEGKAARHLWIVELKRGEPTRAELARALDEALREHAQFYGSRREGDDAPLAAPEVRLVAKGGFDRWLTSEGRIGGQHKVPRILDSAPPELC